MDIPEDIFHCPAHGLPNSSNCDDVGENNSDYEYIPGSSPANYGATSAIAVDHSANHGFNDNLLKADLSAVEVFSNTADLNHPAMATEYTD